jgi:hypothetical protein
MSVVVTGKGPIPHSGNSSNSLTDYGAIAAAGVLEKDTTTVTVSEEAPPLGVPTAEKRFWFQRGAKAYDGDAIATLVSIDPYYIPQV